MRRSIIILAVVSLTTLSAVGASNASSSGEQLRSARVTNSRTLQAPPNTKAVEVRICRASRRGRSTVVAGFRTYPTADEWKLSSAPPMMARLDASDRHIRLSAGKLWMPLNLPRKSYVHGLAVDVGGGVVYSYVTRVAHSKRKVLTMSRMTPRGNLDLDFGNSGRTIVAKGNLSETWTNLELKIMNDESIVLLINGQTPRQSRCMRRAELDSRHSQTTGLCDLATRPCSAFKPGSDSPCSFHIGLRRSRPIRLHRLQSLRATVMSRPSSVPTEC
jgi:hypothetical protein